MPGPPGAGAKTSIGATLHDDEFLPIGHPLPGPDHAAEDALLFAEGDEPGVLHHEAVLARLGATAGAA